MKFQLLKLIIWSKSNEYAPRIVNFKTGKVNVITGASRTGKSAIIPIIDYCLASSDCSIPIDTIRDHTSWYGVVFQTEADQILIAREVPTGNKVSNKFYFTREKLIIVPLEIKESNENSEGIKHILNTISSVPYFPLGEEEKDSYGSRLSFRDLMALCFQTQDIVANQNILFYKMHAHEHRERLRNWFPFILGAENIEILRARQKLQFVEKRLNLLQREFEKVKNISIAWKANMLGHMKIAYEYGLLNEEISMESPPEELLKFADIILENIPEYTQTKVNNIDSANKELLNFEIEEEKVSFEIGQVKRRLSEINRLDKGLYDYKNSQRKRADRLHISKWLDSITSTVQPCPACGSEEHPKTKNEMKKIINAFEKYEEQSKKKVEISTSFIREEERLKIELQRFLDQKNELQKRFDLLLARDKEAQKEFHKSKNMFLFLGHLKASKETFEKLIDGGEIHQEIKLLEQEYNNLIMLVDQNLIKRKLDVAINKISQNIAFYLKTLDVEEKYRRIAPKFSIKDLNISVLSNDDNWHFLAEVGSASNWVSFHIALICALQEYFLELKESCVPSFVVLDQPSQVYFPKLKRTQEELDLQYDDEDVKAVKSIFKTLAESVKNNNGDWQCIVLDHADSSIYGDIEEVYEVEEWRDGIKLIPQEWYMEI
ncbi:DUF3732 domain-containing protein [Paenibacillus sp. KACC 21273]|uniref:DUF3732 domain-containing protein n=1 Tax=Paenibacillus sp. KACC 21273 TaxID=3025665 RepID=UPI00236555AA|nr:DUF3732 domain-containing protein [Paenibacillus sp. KACC 21273]WDF52695.1 DUF3732 domain-containing protein [Paenibacillus sp. KACC 21273]